ncbi:hypothetical protein Tco_1267866, partial [Tanacetum coccineum]
MCITRDWGFTVVNWMEQWFDLSADLLRKALAITPVNPSSPLCYFRSGKLSLYTDKLCGINLEGNSYACFKTQCLTGKTSGSDKTRHPGSANAVGLEWKFRSLDIQKPFGQSSYYPMSYEKVVEILRKNLKRVQSVQPATKRATLKKPETHSPVNKPASSSPSKTFKSKKLSLETPQEKREGEGDDADLERAIKLSLDPAFLPHGRAPVGGVTIRDPVSEATPKLHEVSGKERPLILMNKVIKLLRFDKSGTSSSPEDYTSEERRSMNRHQNLIRKTESDTETAAPKDDKDQGEVDSSTVSSGEKSKVREESDSTIPDSSHQTVTSTPPVIPPFTEVSSSKPSLLVTPPPINTEATTITTSLPEITPFIALQLQVARLEQEMSEVKKTDHSADVLASIRSQVPTAVDNYLGTKLDDALLKVLERHTADLIEKYSVLPGPESVKNQESEKSPKEIIKAKREQDEEKQDSTYSIRSTDKVDLEGLYSKSALFSHMNKKKSANKNTTNYRLYHALMEALIADEDAMDKEVADKVKDHKRKHDSDDDEDDDDDEGPSAKPPPKDDDQSSKKPRESDASASKQHPALTSTGWQITDTRDAGADSSMHRSDPESEHSEQSSDDISRQDE